MKNFLFLTAGVICLATVYVTAQVNLNISQGSALIGVGPTSSLHSFYVGHQFDEIVPFIGLQFFSATVTEESPNYKDEYSALLFMPAIGAKFFALKKKDLKGYATVSGFLPIIDIRETYSNSPPPDIIDFSSWGLEIGLGAEYFANNQFSIGGEFGFNRIYVKGTESTSSGGTRTSGISLNAIYTRISLNYYFVD